MLYLVYGIFGQSLVPSDIHYGTIGQQLFFFGQEQELVCIVMSSQTKSIYMLEKPLISYNIKSDYFSVQYTVTYQKFLSRYHFELP